MTAGAPGERTRMPFHGTPLARILAAPAARDLVPFARDGGLDRIRR